MNMPILSQRDPRWASQRLGFGGCTIGSDGCLTTCKTMLAGLTDVGMANQYLKAHGGYYGAKASTFDLLGLNPVIQFVDVSDRFPRKPFPGTADLQAHLAEGYPAIIEVNWYRRFRPLLWRIFYGMHFVLLLPGGVIYDPWPIPGDPAQTCELTAYGTDMAEAVVLVAYYEA